MKTIRELLQDADPLRHEPGPSDHERQLRRQTILAAPTGASPAGVRLRPVAVAVAVTLALLATFLVIVGSHVGSGATVDLQAAVRFEVRLAETVAAPGLREVKVPGTDRSIYLHSDSIVTNADIAQARVNQGDDPSRFSIGVEFNTAGAQKIRAATANHIGKPVAVLLDGRVVMAPVLRDPISTSAMITGDFTRAEADRIVNGIIGR